MARTSCIRAWGMGNLIVMVFSRKKALKGLEVNGEGSKSVVSGEG